MLHNLFYTVIYLFILMKKRNNFVKHEIKLLSLYNHAYRERLLQFNDEEWEKYYFVRLVYDKAEW